MSERSVRRAAYVPAVTLLAANAISMVGNVMTFLAVPWYVLETTGSASKTGLTAFAGALPLFVVGVFGGTLVDRLGYKRVSVVSDLASGITVALIPVLDLTVGLEFWHLLVLMFLGALLDAPGWAARTSLLPELAERAALSLERINGAADAMQRGAQIIGPPAAGVLIAWLGPSDVLWIDAATFAVSALLVGIFVPEPGKPVAQKTAPSTSYLADLRAGLRFIRYEQVLRALLLLTMLHAPIDSANVAVVMPVYANEVYGSAFALGLMFAGFAVGALAGSILFSMIGERLPRRALFAAGHGSIVLVTGLMIFTPPLWVLLVIYPLVSIVSGALNPIFNTVLQERTPVGMRARVYGLVDAVAVTAVPASRLGAGYAIEWLGLIPVVVVLTVAQAGVTAAIFVLPALRGMDRRPADVAQGPMVGVGPAEAQWSAEHASNEDVVATVGAGKQAGG